MTNPVPLLAERCRALGVQLTALPAHVAEHFRAVAQEEAATIQADLDDQIAALQESAQTRLRARLERRITLKSVGRAFTLSPKSSPAETPVSPPPSTSGGKEGAA